MVKIIKNFHVVFLLKPFIIFFREEGDFFQGGNHVVLLEIDKRRDIEWFWSEIQNPFNPGKNHRFCYLGSLFGRDRNDPDGNIVLLDNVRHLADVMAGYAVVNTVCFFRVHVECGNDGQFIKLCAALGYEHLCADPRFLRMSDRTRNREELIPILFDVFVQQPTSHWLALLEDSEVPNGSINAYDKVFEHPQVVHRGLRIAQQHIHGGMVSTVRNPIRLSDTPVEYRHPPPVRAQHTDEVLREILGLNDLELDDLKQCKAVESNQQIRRAGP